MKESDLESVLAKYPDLIEAGLILKGRQVTEYGRRMDLLFEDKHKIKLIVELKAGPIKDEHIGQILSYEGTLLSADNPDIRVMLVATRVPPNIQKTLDHHGIAWKEIKLAAIKGFLANKGDNQFDNLFEDEIAMTKNETNNNASMHNTPISTDWSTALKANGYSPDKISDLQKAIYTFEQVVLPRKKEREAKVKEILSRFRGKYTVEILDEVFDLVDKDPTGPWFGQMLSKPNRNRLYRCSIPELNTLIDKLLETGDLAWLGHWRRTGNRGMKPGAATLLMYLYSPDRYNIWLPKSHNGLSRLASLDAKSPKGEMSPENYRDFYKEFNEKAIAVREKNSFVPQAMDWILWAAGEIKENPSNRYLRAYIEGRTK